MTYLTVVELQGGAANLRAAVLRRSLRAASLSFGEVTESVNPELGLYPQLDINSVRVGGGEVAFEYIKSICAWNDGAHRSR